MSSSIYEALLLELHLAKKLQTKNLFILFNLEIIVN